MKTNQSFNMPIDEIKLCDEYNDCIEARGNNAVKLLLEFFLFFFALGFIFY